MVERITPSLDNSPDHSKNIPEEQPAPFRIRGHHLDQYIYLIAGSETPESTALGQKKAALRYLKHGLKDRIFDFVKYAVDVIGLTPWQARHFVRNQQTVFEEFLSLLPEHPIELVEGVRDEICNGCIYGFHCKVRYPDERTDTVAIDGRGIDTFFNKAKSLSLDEDIIFDSEKAKFSDTHPTNVRILKTSMATLKTVLLNWEE